MANEIMFRLSGVDLGEYVFAQNPEIMDVMSPRKKREVSPIIRGENIVMRPLLDENVRVMKWSRTTNEVYADIRAYSVRNQYGEIPISYFWDGTVNEFQGAPVRVLDVYATPIAGDSFTSQNPMRTPSSVAWTLEVQIVPVRV